jgi:hypothetical protein
LISIISCPLLMSVLGAAITLALIYGGEADPGLKPGSARAGRATVSDDGEAVHVTVCVPSDDPLTRVVVRDEGGKDLVDLKVYRDGHFNVESGPLAPVRFDVWRFATDAVGVYAGTTNNPVEFTLDTKPDGPSDVMFKDTARQSTYRVQVTAEGEVIPDELGRPLGPDGGVPGPP